MRTPHEAHRVGLDAVDVMTTLHQRVRNAHPTAGLYQAAELQWWWTIRRSTDTLSQLFWFDDGLPVAAVTATDFGGGNSALYQSVTLVVTVLPDASTDWVSHVVDRGFAHVAAYGIAAVEMEVGRDDEVMRDVLTGRGFEVLEGGMTECWLDAETRPDISALAAGYRLVARADDAGRRHHMADARRPDIEARLHETSLYRPDLDLVVYDRDDEPAAYGLFWYDPVTATGVVEPMRTHERHRQRGLARHVLTTGIDLLATAGARRISIGYQPNNPASGPLYRSVGFVPHRQTDVWAGTLPTPDGDA